MLFGDKFQSKERKFKMCSIFTFSSFRENILFHPKAIKNKYQLFLEFLELKNNQLLVFPSISQRICQVEASF